MILGILAVLQVAVPLAAAPPADTLPRVTLAEAIREAARLDPNYVAALGQVDNAEWVRRAAWLAFVLPSVTVSADYTKSSTPSFNFGTNELSRTSVSTRIDARYALFGGGDRLADLSRGRAEVEVAHAGERQARFLSALQTESAYYDVLTSRELAGVAEGRVRRADEQLRVARARVLSGDAVQSDSLQVLLELTRARVDLLTLESRLRVARLQLGRLVGRVGPVDAIPLDSARAADLPLDLDAAVATALAQGPSFRIARANERAARAALRSRRGAWLPQVTLSASTAAFDTQLFPDAAKRSTLSFSVSFPLWNNGQREIAITQARVNRDVARLVREDLERGARRDVTEGYEAYQTARASTDLSATAVVAARENYRVQEARYRSGATTILDLLEAQVNLSDAEARLVQSRYATQLALAGLEVLIGRRLFSDRTLP